MNYLYHIELLKKSSKENDRFKGDAIYDVLVNKYQESGVESAMKDLVGGMISISEYVERIAEYDREIVEYYLAKPQKSNPVNTGQNKLYPSWREQKWAPIFEKIRLKLQTRSEYELKLVQNAPVTQIVYDNGESKCKDVDCGIVIECVLDNKKILSPVLVSEDKGGHACIVCFDGVAGVAGNFKKSFPLCKVVFITDNNVSVKKDISSSIFQDINMVICERGDNLVGLKPKQYIPLKPERFQALYDESCRYFTREMLSQLTDHVVLPVRASGKFREQIDRTGLFVNF